MSYRALPTALFVGTLAAASGAAYLGHRWVTTSAYFHVTDLELVGNEQLAASKLRSVLALGPQTNIFAVDVDELEARLVANPWIAKASVGRSLPGGLEIEVLEESPIAVVRLDHLYLLNADGTPFKRASIALGEVEGLCIITGLSREGFVDAPEQSAERLRYAIAALQSYQSNAKRPKIGELHLDDRHGITLITYEDAIAIHLGTPDEVDFDQRFKTFDSAWRALDPEEHAAARAFRIADRTPSDQVTIAFAGN